MAYRTRPGAVGGGALASACRRRGFAEETFFVHGGVAPGGAAAGAAAFVFASAPAPGGVLDYAGTPAYIEGTVIEEPLVYDDHSAYRLRVEIIETKEGRFAVPGTLLVKIYGAERENYWFGERLRLRGTINEPKGLRNPGGFDYRFYLRTQGIDGLVYPRPVQVNSLGEGNAGWLAASAAYFRSRMVEGIEANLPSPAAELLTAVLFGQRHRLPDEVEENFRRAGAGHLMAAQFTNYMFRVKSLKSLKIRESSILAYLLQLNRCQLFG